jgi:hypothetical protein
MASTPVEGGAAGRERAQREEGEGQPGQAGFALLRHDGVAALSACGASPVTAGTAVGDHRADAEHEP